MEKLLELKWNGDNLAIRRDWDERLKKKAKGADDGNELDEKIKELIDRGLPKVHAEKLAERMLEAEHQITRGGQKKSQVEKAFYAVQAKAGGAASRGSSSSGKQRQLRFSNRSISGAAVFANEDISFQFTEIQGDERSFKISDDGDGKVKFEFSFNDLFVRLVQFKTGKTQLIWIADDQADVYIGDSFEDFVKRNSQAAEQLLFPLFKRLGIKTPLSKTGPRILAAAIKRLQQMQEPDDEKLAQLIKDLDSDNYQVREDASQALSDGYEEWSAQIKEYLKDTKLSLEARVRLKDIIQESSENESTIFINDLGLLESPEFLVNALEFADETQKASVAKQLQKVTGQAHGTDLKAWKNWLQKNK